MFQDVISFCILFLRESGESLAVTQRRPFSPLSTDIIPHCQYIKQKYGANSEEKSRFGKKSVFASASVA